MKKFNSILAAICFASVILTIGCGPKKHEYPADVTQNFMNSCQQNGSSQEMCSCLLEKIQKKYTLDEFIALDAKATAGQPIQDFIDFIDKEKLECSKK